MKVTDREIRELDKLQLTQLAHLLLISEARSHQIPASAVECSFNIDTGDGGEDASIRWDGNIDETDYLVRDTLLQVKATAMSVTACKKEVFEKSGGIKSKIRELMERGGTYILFCNRDARGNQAQAIAEALESKGYPNANVRSYNPTKIATWTNKYFSAIRFVKEVTGRPLPLALQTWKKLSRFSTHTKTRYIADETRQDYIVELRSAASRPNSVIRLCGLSGLGKTRLVIEALSDSTLRETVCFIDAGAGGDVVGHLTAWLQSQLDGVLVVDNCSSILHEHLSELALHPDSKLSLITINFDPHDGSGPHQYIELKPMARDTVKGIISEKFQDLPEINIESVAEPLHQFAHATWTISCLLPPLTDN